MLNETMRMIASALQTPVVCLLVLLVAIMIIMIGMLVAEVFTERRHFDVAMPLLVDELQRGSDVPGTIERSGLLRRQRDALIELLRHPDASDDARESMAVNLVFVEQSHFDNRVKVTDTIAKISPMLGLMGTLIPLGPGLMAIGSGDTSTLSASLLMAFDTTVLGLVVAAVSVLISTIRKSWYAKYMSAFEAATECVLEAASGHRDFGLASSYDGFAAAASQPQHRSAALEEGELR